MYIVYLFDIFMFIDSRIKDLFLLYDNLVYVWIIILVYILFVILIGLRYMKNRLVFIFFRFLVVYNSILVVWFIYMFVEVSYLILRIIMFLKYLVYFINGRYRNFLLSIIYYEIVNFCFFCDLIKNCLFVILVYVFLLKKWILFFYCY